MNQSPFEPFQDRLSRDIRNQLSESLMTCMRLMRLGPAQEVAHRFLGEQPGPAQIEYIEKRMALYGLFLHRIAEGPADALWQGLVLWDLGLYFEVHEILAGAGSPATATGRLY
jgi:hypothetical protein